MKPQAVLARARTRHRGRAPALILGYAFVGPAIILLATVLVFPLLSVAFQSLTIEVGKGRVAFVGVANYQEILQDDQFWKALSNTLIFTAASVVGHLLVGLAAALLLNCDIPGRVGFRVVALLPWMFSSVVTGVTWKWMYSPDFGILNQVLLQLRILKKYVAWLGELKLAMPAVIFTNIWRGFPFVMLILLAGLQAIPREEYEASAVDGASSLQQFLHITLPHLRYLMIIATTLDVIWTFRYFDLMQIMTAGGPAGATEVLTTLIFKASFEQFRFGYASAIAVLMFIVLLAFTILYAFLILRERKG